MTIKPKPPKPTVPELRVSSVIGGFKIQSSASTENTQFPYRVTIQAAYEIARGSAFTKYIEHDFDFEKSGAITIDVSGDVEIEERKGNQIRAKVSGPRFDLVAKGFDRNRDLKIRTVRRAVIDAEDV